MIIALDRAIPFWKEAFSEFGEIRLFPGRDLKSEDLRGVDALIVRTVTPVNAALLEGSSVRFVASASAGTDHVDQAYLKKRGIHFGWAAGCNADSVSEYIITALHVVAHSRGLDLKYKSLAVIGVGNVGSRVAKKARGLGMEVLLCDPPLRDVTGDRRYQDFDCVLGANILSFHVPLTLDGPYPTWHMLDRNTLDLLSPGQFLINSSRGAVFDNRELKTALRDRRIEGVILDVWEGEPAIDYSLLELADIGTPHIAGSSLDGKVRATEMVRAELCRFLGIQSSISPDAAIPSPGLLRVEPNAAGQEAVLSVLVQAYDIGKDDAGLRALASLPAEQAAQAFARLRSDYVFRPEFCHFTVDLGKQNGNLAETFVSLGFKVRN